MKETPDGWIERQEESDTSDYPCSGCGNVHCICDQVDALQDLEDDVTPKELRDFIINNPIPDSTPERLYGVDKQQRQFPQNNNNKQ